MHASQERDARLGYAYAFYAAVSSHRVMPRSMLQRPHPPIRNDVRRPSTVPLCGDPDTGRQRTAVPGWALATHT